MKTANLFFLFLILVGIVAFMFWDIIVPNDYPRSNTPKAYFLHLIEQYRDSLGVPDRTDLIDFFEHSPYPYEEETPHGAGPGC